MITNFITKKLIKLKNSQKVLKLFYYYHYLFHDKKLGNIGFDFSKKKTRFDIVQNIINRKNYKKYLEIGCERDELFNHIDCEKKAGVDPVSGGTIRKTSDQFFSSNNDYFDCIFIDGLHEYDQVYKDIMNSIKFLKDDGLIILHDCLPSSIHQQAVPRYKSGWTGDVWKAIVNIRTRPELDTITCNIDCGLSIIRKKKNHTVLDVKIQNFKNLKFKDFYNNHKNYMRIMNYSETFDYLK